MIYNPEGDPEILIKVSLPPCVNPFNTGTPDELNTSYLNGSPDNRDPLSAVNFIRHLP
jgi:hypothetical protein